MLNQIEKKVNLLEDKAQEYIFAQLQKYSDKHQLEIHANTMYNGDCIVRYSDKQKTGWAYNSIRKRYYKTYDLPNKLQKMIDRYTDIFRRDLPFIIIIPKLTENI